MSLDCIATVIFLADCVFIYNFAPIFNKIQNVMKKFFLMVSAALMLLAGCDKVKDALDTGTDVIIDESGVKNQYIVCPDAYDVVFTFKQTGAQTKVKSYRDGDVCKASTKGLSGEYAVEISGEGTKEGDRYTLSASAENVTIVAGVVNCKLTLTATEKPE